MNVSYIFAAVIIILLLFMLMLWFMFRGLRCVLIDNLQEAIIVVGEDIGLRVDNVQKVIKARIEALQSEFARLDDLADMIKAQAHTLPQSQSQSLDGMFNIIHGLQDETDKILRDFAAKIEQSSQINDKTLAIFDDEIKKLTGAITASIKNLQKASGFITDSVEEIQETCDKNNKLLAEMATQFEGTLYASSGDIRDTFAKIGEDMKAVITESIKKINEGYDTNITQMLQTMTDQFMKDFAAKIEQSSQIDDKTLAIFDDEIKKLTGAITASIKNLQKASGFITDSVEEIQETCDKNNKLLADMAVQFEGTLYASSGDIRDAFAKTSEDLKNIITESMKKINDDYETNITQIFQTMADNLASIKEVLNREYFKPSA